MIDTYEMHRRGEIGDSWREPGEPVPEAHLWRLTEGLVHGNVLHEVQMSEADFAAAVDKYCPDDAQAIYASLGFKPVHLPTKGRKGRTVGKRTVLTTEPKEIIDKDLDDDDDVDVDENDDDPDESDKDT